MAQEINYLELTSLEDGQYYEGWIKEGSGTLAVIARWNDTEKQFETQVTSWEEAYIMSMYHPDLAGEYFDIFYPQCRVLPQSYQVIKDTF